MYSSSWLLVVILQRHTFIRKLRIWFVLTSQKGKSSHSRERMISRSIKKIQLIYFSSNPVQLTVEVFNGGRVAVLELSSKKSGYERSLACTRWPAKRNVSVLSYTAEVSYINFPIIQVLNVYLLLVLEARVVLPEFKLLKQDVIVGGVNLHKNYLFIIGTFEDVGATYVAGKFSKLGFDEIPKRDDHIKKCVIMTSRHSHFP